MFSRQGANSPSIEEENKRREREMKSEIVGLVKSLVSNKDKATNQILEFSKKKSKNLL